MCLFRLNTGGNKGWAHNLLVLGSNPNPATNSNRTSSGLLSPSIRKKCLQKQSYPALRFQSPPRILRYGAMITISTVVFSAKYSVKRGRMEKVASTGAYAQAQIIGYHLMSCQFLALTSFQRLFPIRHQTDLN